MFWGFFVCVCLCPERCSWSLFVFFCEDGQETFCTHLCGNYATQETYKRRCKNHFRTGRVHLSSLFLYLASIEARQGLFSVKWHIFVCQQFGNASVHCLSGVISQSVPWWCVWFKNWSHWLFLFLDSQEAVQQQHVRGQVCCIRKGICGVSTPKLPNTPSLRQKQRPGATGTTARSDFMECFSIFLCRSVDVSVCPFTGTKQRTTSWILHFFLDGHL